MEVTRRARGVALYSALGFAVFVFFLVTALSARVQFNLRLVEGAAERSRLLSLAQGGCNEVIARLNNAPGKPPTREQPYRRTEGGATLEVWFQDDPTHPEIQHVRARAASAGVEQEFERVVRRGQELRPVFFTTGVRQVGQPVSILRNSAGSPDWDLLPPLPNFTADDAGSPRRLEGFSTTVHGVSADQEGNAYAVTAPEITQEPYRTMFQQMQAQTMSGMGRLAEGYLAWGQAVEQFGPVVAQILSASRPVLVKYSGRDNAWRALPHPPDLSLDPATGEFQALAQPIPGFLVQPTAGADQNQLFVGTIRQGQDSIQQYEGGETSASWRALPAPPARAYAGPQIVESPGYCKALLGLSCSPEGTMFSQWSRTRSEQDTAMSSVFRYDADQRTWAVLPPPPRQYGSVPIMPFQLLGQMQAGPRGTLYMTFWTPPDPRLAGLPKVPDQVIKYSPATDSWTLVTPPPASYYDQTGSLAPGPPRTTIDSLGLDSDGGLLVKYPQMGGPHTVYRKTREFEPMPTVPRSGHDAEGQQVHEPGFLSAQANVAGGGVPTGATRYVPTASY